MSGRPPLDDGALLWDLARPRQALLPRHSRVAGSIRLEVSKDRRSTAPLKLLSREFDAACTEACDPWEIAAVLEAAGIDDAKAREEYGAEGGVFEVAHALWLLVPRRPSLDGGATDPWARPLRAHLAHGLANVLPIVLYLTALQFVPLRPRDVIVLVVAAVVAAGAGQVLSVLDHVLTGRRELEAAGHVVRRALAAAGVFLLAMITVAPLAGMGRAAAALAASLVIYQVSATALHVAGADRLLLAVLVPAALGCVAVLLTPAGLAPWAPLVPAAGVAAAAAAVLGVHRHVHPRGPGARTPAPLATLLGDGEIR
jgi:hypothetical protein